MATYDKALIALQQANEIFEKKKTSLLQSVSAKLDALSPADRNIMLWMIEKKYSFELFSKGEELGAAIKKAREQKLIDDNRKTAENEKKRLARTSKKQAENSPSAPVRPSVDVSKIGLFGEKIFDN